jgi:hypothetical protein
VQFGCDAFAAIQAGLEGVTASGTVNVAAGTYTENVTVTKGVTITGEGAGVTTLIPALSGPNPCSGASLCPGASNLMLIEASDVTISGLTLDGDNPAITSAYDVGGANLDARNGIITNHGLGSTITGLNVHHTTVRNIYLRGMYASTSLGTFDFHDNTVTNVQAEGASIGMFSFTASGAYTNNTVSFCNDAISANHSRGITFTGNTVTNSASGIHTDNSNSGGGTADTISGNTVSDSPVNGYGIWVFVPYNTVTVENNSVTNVDIGLGSFGYYSLPARASGHAPQTASYRPPPPSLNTTEPGRTAIAADPGDEGDSPALPPYSASFTGNMVDGQNKANSIGAYISTTTFFFPSGNNKTSMARNTVTGNADGFYLEAQTGFTLETAIEANRIYGNTVGVETDASGTLNGSMENNWWGCNGGPNTAGCETAAASGTDFDPWVVLGVTASPSAIDEGGTSTLTADMTMNSDGMAFASGPVADMPVSLFSAVQGTMDPTSGTITSGTAASTFTSNSGANGSACATVDNQQICAPITVTPAATPTPTPATFTIDVTQTANGTITPDDTVVAAGGNAAFQIEPDPGFNVESVTVDGSPAALTSPYTFTNVTADHTITATFAAAACRTLTIPALSAVNGSEISIPVNTDDVTGYNVISAQFKVAYNTGVLSPVAGADNVVVTPGPVVPAGSLIFINRSTPGVIEVSITGSAPLEGEGALVEIHMNVVGNGGAVSPLTLTAIDPMFPTVFYNGGAVCAAPVSGTFEVLFVQTAVMVSATPNPSVYGSSVSFTASVTPGVTEGTVDFIEGGTCAMPAATLASSAVNGSGQASFSTSALTAGAHTITACYGGAINHAPSSGSVVHVVDQLQVAASVTADDKTYDRTTAATIASCTIPGKLGMDDVACTAAGPNSFADSNAGTGKTITATNISLTGADAGNYVLSSSTAITYADIDPLAVTVTAVADTKTYDGDTSSSGVPAVVPPVIAGDTGSFSQVFADHNAGTGKTLTPSGTITDGNGGNNYSITFTAVQTGEITALPVTVTAVADAKTYDGDSSSSGTPAVDPPLTGTDTGSFTQVFDNRNAGTGKTLTPSGTITDGNNGNNYSITFTPVNTGVINALAISVTAAASTKTYDATTSSSGVPTIVPALIGPDTAAFVQTFDTRHAGTGKVLTPSGAALDGNSGDNYSVTFNTVATGVINALPVTVTAAADSKTYDGTTASSGVPTVMPALLGTDSGSFVQTFDTRHAGTGKVLTPSGTITDGNNGNNYSITFTPVNTGVINALAISVTAVTDTKTYDGSTSSAAMPTVAPALILPDSGTFTQTFDTPSAGTGKTLTPSGTITDDNGGSNYSVSFVPVMTGTIGQATLVVTPDPKTIFYGSPDPAFTFSYSGFAAGDDAMDLTTQAVCSVAGPSPHEPGVYTITCTAGTALNYNFDVTATALFTVNTGDITGSIKYLIVPSTVVPQVTLNAPGSVNVSTVTSAAGTYTLTGFGGGAYTVTPSRQKQGCLTANGITVNDASLISRHVVHLIELSTDQQLVAKVSGPLTPVLSSYDASLIAQKVVGICSGINQAGQWKFTPPSVDHANGITMNFTENYSAYMMGDVDGDWNPTGAMRPMQFDIPTKDAVIASVPALTAGPGGELTVPFRIDNLAGKAVGAYQFEVAFDPAVIRPADVAAAITGTMSEGLSVVSHSPEPGLLKVAVYGALPVNGDGVYAELRFTVTGTVGSSTPLAISGFILNDNTAEVTTVGGSVKIVDETRLPSIIGRLVTSTGDPVAGGMVTLTDSTGRSRSAVAGRDGAFAFGDLISGQTYTLRVNAAGYGFAPVTISAADRVTAVDMIANPLAN